MKGCSWVNSLNVFELVMRHSMQRGQLQRGRSSAIKLTNLTHYGKMATKPASSGTKRDVVQVKNPRSGHYVKIDRTAGKIIAHKQSEGQYKNVPVARKRK